MARPTRPGDLMALDPNECTQRLADAPWARIAFVADGLPTVLPVNVLLHREAIYFQTAAGSKLAAAAASGAVAVQVDGGDPDARTGWSVLAQGTASIVTDQDLDEDLWALDFEPWAIPDARHFWIQVEVTSITGREILR